METRKTNKANLERKRPILFQLGLIVAISASLAAFEWKTPYYGTIVLPPAVNTEIPEEIINVVKEKKPDLPKPLNSTLLKEVDNDKKDIPDIKIIADIDPLEGVELYKLPELTPEDSDETSDIFTVVEQMPEFPGGYVAMLKYLKDNIIYPTQAKEAGITGTVFVTFVVDENGRIASIKVLRDVPGGCTEEAVRVISGMPKWAPGKQRGKPVKVQYNMPIKFNLQ